MRPATKTDIDKIMATQADILALEQAQLALLQTITTEIDSLETLVTTLQGQVNSGNVTPELAAAVQAVSDQLGVVQGKLAPAPAPAAAPKA